jgi:uncharacterized heparinase superfamily protein
VPKLRIAAPAVPFLGAPGHARCDGQTIRLINREAPFGSRIDWNDRDGGPLWTYHLHQFDWARCSDLSPADRLGVFEDWIAHHRDGIGWDAGPISLRTFAWLKLLATPGALPDDGAARDRILSSLRAQLLTLEERLETHVQANHYLWNLLALVFAGVLLEAPEAPRWLAYQGRLRGELEEQIGADGAHYERSPMYHALLLENLLDLWNALQATSGRQDELFTRLAETAARMLGALEVWTHPDGGIALFADSAFEVAALPAQLADYGRELGVIAQAPEKAGVLAQAGYARLEAGPFVLIASAGVPRPAYQPGHAHADALGFELSVSGQRVVTDTGVFEYVAGERRATARATRSHATVEVDGADQSEMWAAHRVGGRCDAAFTGFEPGRAADGVCASWSSPEVLHRRHFEVTSEAVRLRDEFELPAPRARAFLPLAPGLEPVLEEGRARIPLEGGATLVLELPSTAAWSVARAPYFPEFGLSVERAVLVGEATDLEELDWVMRLS